MTEYKMKSEQVGLPGVVVGGEEREECRTISKFPQWVTKKVVLLMNGLWGRKSSLEGYKNDDFILYLVNFGELWKTQMEMANT